MNILIIEDKEKHILSAEKFATESGHSVTIATTYDEAEKALCGEDHFGRKDPVTNFDVVLTDMFLPASRSGLADPSEFRGTEQPYGLSFMLLAMRTGVKTIGLLTDGNHHANPMIWALDTLRGYDGKPFTIGDTTVLCSSNGFFLSHWNETDSPKFVPEGDPLEGAKDWGHLLLDLQKSIPIK